MSYSWANCGGSLLKSQSHQIKILCLANQEPIWIYLFPQEPYVYPCLPAVWSLKNGWEMSSSSCSEFWFRGWDEEIVVGTSTCGFDSLSSLNSHINNEATGAALVHHTHICFHVQEDEKSHVTLPCRTKMHTIFVCSDCFCSSNTQTYQLGATWPQVVA